MSYSIWDLPPAERTIIGPKEGWAPETYYVVEVSVGKSNPIHKAIFFSGFLNGGEGQPGGYNQIWNPTSEPQYFSTIHYLRVVEKLQVEEDPLDEEAVPPKKLEGNRTVFRKEGKYLRMSVSVTHTGRHCTYAWVDSLDEATLFPPGNPTAPRDRETFYKEVEGALAIYAYEERKVTLGRACKFKEKGDAEA